MTFVSYGFPLFLAAALLVYYCLPGRVQWMGLLAFSLLFYLASGVPYICFILFTGISIYITARRIQRTDDLRRKRRALLLGILLNVGILAVIKYTNFAIWNVNLVLLLTGSPYGLETVDWVLPLGISYYTLQALGYLIDCYYGKSKAETNPFRLLLFLSFFPQLIQGPISRFGSLKESLFSAKRWSWQRTTLGLQRILWGFFKKLVVADRVAPVVSAIGGSGGELDGIYVLIGMLAYTLQLYGDFTGGIDIAVGCAQMFGVELPENFRCPFGAGSLAEYWRRWHITLMQWFREYVFYPLSGSKAARKMMGQVRKVFGRKMAARVPVYFASLITWFLTGIWHGATWNFAVWGLGNCAILLISQELTPLYRRFHKACGWASGKWYSVFSAVRTLLLVSAVQMLEYYPSPWEALGMFVQMFGAFRPAALFDGRWEMLGITGADTAVLLLSTLLFIRVGAVQKTGSAREWIGRKPEWVRWTVWFGLFLAVLILGAYGQGYDASQFIYNQF